MEGRVIEVVGAPPGGGAPRYRLRPSIELFPLGDDVYLLGPNGATAMVVRNPNPRDRALLERLAREPVEAPDGSETAHRLEPLAAADALLVVKESTRLPPALSERFARQLPYFAETGDAVKSQLSLRNSTAVVLGCGGLGTWALAALACIGVGGFVLVDDDTVEISNLNRQVLYGSADIGHSKVDCAARWLRALDPDLRVHCVRRRVTGEQDAAEVVAGADVVLLMADWPPYELGRWVNRACVGAGVPFVLAGQQPPLLKVGPTFVPGGGPCFACLERRLSTDFPLYPKLAEHRRRHPRPDITLGTASGVVGTLVALEVMHLLAGEDPVATQGRALLIDMRTLEQRWEGVDRDPACPVCRSA